MSGAAPWSVKGIDPKAREVAKDLARRSGMTLGEWLNSMIMEDDDDDGVSPLPRRPHMAEMFERRGRSRRLDDAYTGSRYEGEDTLHRIGASVEALSARLEAAERRSTVAIQGVDQAVAGLLRRIEARDEDAKSSQRRIDDIAEELREGHRRLRRFENETGPGTAEAFSKMETAIGAVTSRLYDIEERQRLGAGEVARRLDAFDKGGAADRLKDSLDQALGAMAGRIQGIEERQRAGGEALSQRLSAVERSARDLPGADLLAQAGARLDAAQAQTTEALRRLEGSFADLDRRLRDAEGRVEPQGVREAARFEKLAETLAQQVESNRQEMMRRLDVAQTENRIDRVERAVLAMGDGIKSAEQRGAQAVEAMGREVLRIAQNLNGRMQRIEGRGAEQADRLTASVNARLDEVGGELSRKLDRDMGRFAEGVEQRLMRADDRHALAIEKLGDEITRISDRLADRIAQSERKSAEALEDIGRRLADSADRAEQRYDRTSGELAERMRLSEERTAQLLSDAQASLGRRPARVERPVPDEGVEPLPDWRAAAFPGETFAEGWDADPLASDVDPAPFPGALSMPTAQPAATPQATFAHPVAREEVAPAPEALFEPTYAPEPTHTAESAATATEPHFAAMDEFARPAAEPAPLASAFGGANVGDALEATAPGFGASPTRGGFDPDQIDFAGETEFVDPRALRAGLAAGGQAGRAASTRSALDAARAAMSTAPEPAPRSTFGQGLGLNSRKGGKSRLQERLDQQSSRDGSTVRKALLASVTGMAVVAGVYSTARLTGHHGLGIPGLDSAISRFENNGQPLDGDAPIDAEPILASALTPIDATPTTGSVQAQSLYDQALQQIESGDAAGVSTLTRAAEQGSAAAQVKLAFLYQNGEAGLARDPSQARQWAKRAADSGNPSGMFNYGMYLYDGVGGAKDRTGTRTWLTKAADAGFVDAQYNLARMLEAGDGGDADPVQAFKWYLIAARTGDQDSQAAVNRLTPTLAAEAKRTARQQAADFQTQPID